MTKAFAAAGVAIIACVSHEVNRAWCEFNGDASQPGWADAPEWQRDSAIAGVLFHLANPEADDSASHDSWMAQKLADGWVYGETKDPEAKTHPCLLPFDQLPKEQQFKDRLFRTIVHAFPVPVEEARNSNVTDLLDAKIETIAEMAPALNLVELLTLLAAEQAGKTRKGAMAALKAAIMAEAGHLLSDGAEIAVVPADAIADLRARAETAERAAAPADTAPEVAEAVAEEVAPPPPDEPIDLIVSAEADSPIDAPMFIAFVSQGKLIGAIAPQPLSPGFFKRTGDRALLEVDVAILPETPPARVDHAVLLDVDGELAGICEIPGGLAAGGGKRAEFPAGHLIFSITAPPPAEPAVEAA